MASWHLEYIIKRDTPDNYIIVMFHNTEYYKTRVFFVENLNSETPIFTKVKSGEAIRYRDGGTTHIETEHGTIYLPFRGKHVLAPLDVDIDAITNPILNLFGSKREKFIPGETITLIRDTKSSEDSIWFQNIKKFVQEMNCVMDN